MGHLGTRVSALLDGQLAPDEEERAWAHVHACHSCRDLVEREGWVKTRLAGLGRGEPDTPLGLKGSLLSRLGESARPADAVANAGSAPDGLLPSPHAWAGWATAPGDVFLEMDNARRPRRAIGMAALGGGAVGAAMMGVLAFGAAPADAPTIDRRVPTTITQPGPVPVVGPQRRPIDP